MNDSEPDLAARQIVRAGTQSERIRLLRCGVWEVLRVRGNVIPCCSDVVVLSELDAVPTIPVVPRLEVRDQVWCRNGFVFPEVEQVVEPGGSRRLVQDKLNAIPVRILDRS